MFLAITQGQYSPLDMTFVLIARTPSDVGTVEQTCFTYMLSGTRSRPVQGQK